MFLFEKIFQRIFVFTALLPIACAVPHQEIQNIKVILNIYMFFLKKAGKWKEPEKCNILQLCNVTLLHGVTLNNVRESESEGQQKCLQEVMSPLLSV